MKAPTSVRAPLTVCALIASACGGGAAATVGASPPTDGGVLPSVPDGGGGATVLDASTADAADGAAAPLDAAAAPLDASLDGGLSLGDLCGYSYSGFNSSPSVNATSTVTWTCTATTRTVKSDGLPDHDVGTFPNANCPNTITAQTVSASMPMAPEKADASATAAPAGFAYNGVKFDPTTAGTCTVTDGGASCSLASATGAWNIEALGQTTFNFGVDSNNAHVQPSGSYHYHGMPTSILTKLAKGAAMTLVGYAVDGFPIYARYGYTTPTDPSSPIKVMTGSYQLKASPDPGRPSTTTYPMGAFTQDYEYVAGSGDLDKCNGRTGVTPEYPAGTYHYFITDTYPFIQRCVTGTPTYSEFPGGAPPGGGPPGGGPPGGGPPHADGGP